MSFAISTPFIFFFFLSHFPSSVWSRIALLFFSTPLHFFTPLFRPHNQEAYFKVLFLLSLPRPSTTSGLVSSSQVIPLQIRLVLHELLFPPSPRHRFRNRPARSPLDPEFALPFHRDHHIRADRYAVFLFLPLPMSGSSLGTSAYGDALLASFSPLLVSSICNSSSKSPNPNPFPFAISRAETISR